MTTVTTRAGKGSALTNTELDANFTALRDGKVEVGLDAPQTLTDASTITWDVATYYNAKVTLGGNRTLAAPTNYYAGQTITLAITQDATGSRTLSFNAAYDFGEAGTPTLSTVASRVDVLVAYCYDATTPKFRAALNKAA